MTFFHPVTMEKIYYFFLIPDFIWLHPPFYSQREFIKYPHTEYMQWGTENLHFVKQTSLFSLLLVCVVP